MIVNWYNDVIYPNCRSIVFLGNFTSRQEPRNIILGTKLLKIWWITSNLYQKVMFTKFRPDLLSPILLFGHPECALFFRLFCDESARQSCSLSSPMTRSRSSFLAYPWWRPLPIWNRRLNLTLLTLGSARTYLPWGGNMVGYLREV